MTAEQITSPGGPSEDMGDHASLGESFSRVGRAAQQSFHAELTLVKARASIIGAAAQSIALFGVIALILLLALIVTLMIGAVMALAPHWGIGWALLAVTGVALLAIIFCGVAIMAQVKRIKEGTR